MLTLRGRLYVLSVYCPWAKATLFRTEHPLRYYFRFIDVGLLNICVLTNSGGFVTCFSLPLSYGSFFVANIKTPVAKYHRRFIIFWMLNFYESQLFLRRQVTRPYPRRDTLPTSIHAVACIPVNGNFLNPFF